MPSNSTLRTRLTLWYVAALSVTLVTFAVLLYSWLDRTLYRHHDPELLSDAARVVQQLEHGPLDALSIATELAELPTAPRLLMIRDQSGELIYRSPVLGAAEPTLGHHEALVHAAAHAPRDPEFFTVALEPFGPVRFICTPLPRTPQAYVQVGSELGDVPATMHSVAVASMVLVPFVVLLMSVGGWLIAGRALAPIGSIDAKLRAIEATDLSRRVDVYPADQELSRLVATVNGLLARLDRAFQDLREFTADASHQLQTPLTILKSSVELARRQAPAGIPAAVLDDIEEEVDDMSSVVRELQALSLADADTQGATRADVDLSEVCVDAVEILRALGEARGVSVDADIEPRVIVTGDAAKLKQVVLNLGDNAVKYSPEGGRVTLLLQCAGKTASLHMIDSGIGIAPDIAPRIFERFFRGRSDRSAPRGSGLGLAIAKRIIDVHGGTICVSSQPGEPTRFTVCLPLRQSDQRPAGARKPVDAK